MVVLLWIAFGLLVGGIAAALSPNAGNVRSVAGMMGLAAVGALMGGFTGRAFGLYASFRSIGSIGMAVVGAVLFLAVYTAFIARRTVTSSRG